MAPTVETSELLKPRYNSNYCSGYGYYYSGGGCYYSSWNYWGRWVVTGVLILFFVLIFMCLLCVRRRRRRGMTPMYGTGWAHSRFAGPNNMGGGQYGNQPNYGGQNYAAPPQYSQNPQREYNQGASHQPSDGYYGQHNEGIQLQQPGQAYYGNSAGPPPSKIA